RNGRSSNVALHARPRSNPLLMTRVILASGSATRQAMLRAAGVDFTVDVAVIDETTILESLQAEGAKARDAADTLAEMKALKISTKHPDALVIGADQVL